MARLESPRVPRPTGARLGGSLLGADAAVGGCDATAVLGGQGGDVGGQLVASSTGPSTSTRSSKKDFPTQTGIKLKYSGHLEDNNEFFAKTSPAQPGPSIRDSTSSSRRLDGRSGSIELGYAQKLPLDDIPNAANLGLSCRTRLGTPRASTRCRGRRA